MDRRLEGLDLNLLMGLHWLLTERSVTGAANRLGVSQPAASRMLARLRDVFDDPILVKSGADMVATPQGERLQPLVGLAIERCRDVLRLSERFDPASASGVFRICCADYLGAMAAAAWGDVIAPEAPALGLDIVTPTLEASRDLVSGRIDLCILPDLIVMNLPPTIDVDQYVKRPIMAQQYVSALRREHPRAGEPLDLETFTRLGHILVSPEGAGPVIVDTALERLGRSRHIAYRISSFLLALPIVLNTDCVLTGPHTLMNLMRRSLYVFEPPLSLPTITIYAVWHPNWSMDGRHRWVRERLFAALDMPRCAGAD